MAETATQRPSEGDIDWRAVEESGEFQELVRKDEREVAR